VKGPGEATQLKGVDAPGTPSRQTRPADPWAEEPIRPGGKGFLWVLLSALLLTILLSPVPRLPLGTNDDSSWSAVLGYAHETGLQFGSDVVFTYGPLGFLLTPYHSVAAPGMSLAAGVIVTFVAVLGLCLLAWRLHPVWRVVALVVLVLTAANTEPRMELILNLALLGWGVLCLVETGELLPLVMLAALAVFGGLGKGTLLFTGTMCVVAVAADLFLRGRRLGGLGLLVGFVLCCVAAWLALSQDISNLGKFITSTLEVVRGYSAGMGLDQLPLFVVLGLSIALLGIPVIALGSFGVDRPERGFKAFWRGCLQFAWFSAWLFLIWKQGFVRVGRDHIVLFIGFVPIMLLSFGVFRVKAAFAKYVRGSLVGLVCMLSLVMLVELFAGDVRACLYRPCLLFAHNSKALFTPGAYQREMRELQEAERDAMQLPKLRQRIGNGSVDVFGFRQAYAVFNDLNFRPRPVFQSYAAYSAALMRRNEAFYHSTNAPQFTLFRLEALDEHFPPLEDGFLLRDLLFNYEPVDAEGPFLLLKRKGAAPVVLQYVREGAVRPGELVDLRDQAGADVWLQLELEPTLFGRARDFFYQPPPVELGVWCQGSPNLRRARFPAPAPMLAAGFLASPLLVENDDVLDLYTGTSITRPVAFSIELPAGAESYWQPNVHFRIYRIINQLGRCVTPQLGRLLKFPGFEAAPSQILAPTNAILQVAGQPVLFVPPKGEIHFDVPTYAKLVRGALGFAPGAYSFGGSTEGAQFRIEEELPDVSRQLLYSQTLTPVNNPADRGMKPFSVPCPGEGARRLILRALPVSANSPAWDMTCWARLAFE
jgi:hypothetical protein